MNELILAAAVLLGGFAVTLVVAGVAGRDEPQRPTFRPARRWRPDRCGSPRGGVAAGLGAGTWLASGWPVAGLAVAALVFLWPWLFGAGQAAAQRIERLEALADWLRGLADVLQAGSAGLVGALQSSASDAPPAIAGEVTTLAQRLRTWNVPKALLSLADDLDDEVADAAAAGLCVAYTQGSGVVDLLRTLARQIADDVAARRDAEAERARRRSAARILLGLWCAMFIGFAIFGSSSYTSVYDSTGGQIVLAVILGVVGLAVVWLRRLGLEPRAERFLTLKERT
ncbi:type II secretion system F family protein [Amycolatopsis sp. RTGN1]|uniref:type II secretion system F family protein n=1 Tax=Amycolatopsis ponsaeliensis TaxID=2992142 RepID=UPI00254D36A8|nr:type II secretion system F family protein [Amycolatopsis sp. RTGN1]